MSSLYVLIRDDLEESHSKAAQGGHAVAQFKEEHPYAKWRNERLIYVTVKNEFQLEKWMYKFEDLEMMFSYFREPDLDDSLTAIAVSVDSDTKLFNNLRLLEG